MVSSDQAASQQEALTLLLLSDLRHLWPSLDPTNLAGTYPVWLKAMTALISRYGLASRAVAVRYYTSSRNAAGVSGRFTIPSTPGTPTQQIDRSLGWATRALREPEPDLAATRTLTEGVAQRLVADQGRNTLIAAIESDQRCRGWAREARPGACAFCAMLSTRGAVYKSKQTASQVGQTGRAYHDHCHCLPVPLFADHYEPPAHVRAWERLYADSTRGLSGDSARAAFRDALAQQS